MPAKIFKGKLVVKFFIAGIRRTGTTAIRTALDEHPQIRCVGEAFNFGDRFKTIRGLNCEDGYRQYINSIAAGRVRDLVMRTNTVNRYLDHLYNLPGYDAIGFKIMHFQHRRFPMVLQYLRRHNVRCVHIIRKNVLKTLISCAVKRETGRSHTTSGLQKVTVTLDEGRLIKDLERYDRDNNAWISLTDGLPYLLVYYEDFVENKSHELTRICEFLQVDPVPELEPRYVKGSPNDIREIILNYDAVASILKGSRFGWCLEA